MQNKNVQNDTSDSEKEVPVNEKLCSHEGKESSSQNIDDTSAKIEKQKQLQPLIKNRKKDMLAQTRSSKRKTVCVPNGAMKKQLQKESLSSSEQPEFKKSIVSDIGINLSKC